MFLRQQVRFFAAQAKKPFENTLDYYARLGVKSDAGRDDIKLNFYKMAKKYHPDHQTSRTEKDRASSEEVFKNINDAYEILSNPKLKSAYDRERSQVSF